jgi:hypothetical protein
MSAKPFGDEWKLVFVGENNNTFVLGDGNPDDEYDFFAICMENCHDQGKHCELIGNVDVYPTLPEENNPLLFQYVTNRFRNSVTGMIDVVTYYYFDHDPRVYCNVVSVANEADVNVDEFGMACMDVRVICDGEGFRFTEDILLQGVVDERLTQAGNEVIRRAMANGKEVPREFVWNMMHFEKKKTSTGYNYSCRSVPCSSDLFYNNFYAMITAK